MSSYDFPAPIAQYYERDLLGRARAGVGEMVKFRRYESMPAIESQYKHCYIQEKPALPRYNCRGCGAPLRHGDCIYCGTLG
jgi:hypothetical protein